jgi:hypothetical protein
MPAFRTYNLNSQIQLTGNWRHFGDIFRKPSIIREIIPQAASPDLRQAHPDGPASPCNARRPPLASRRESRDRRFRAMRDSGGFLAHNDCDHAAQLPKRQ